MPNCDSYYDSFGKYQPLFQCSLYCCGTCKDRFCCKFSDYELDQTDCNKDHLINNESANVSTTIFAYFLIFFCICCCCVLIKKWTQETRNLSTTINFRGLLIINKMISNFKYI